MSVIDSILLGIIQGATEFLPISSTAHLTFAGKALGVIVPDHPADWTAFMAVIQLGTLLAVLAYFRTDIVHVVSAVFEESVVSRRKIRDQSPAAQLGWRIVVGTIPVVVLGLALKKIIEGSLTKNLWLLSASMMFFALVLWLAERVAKKNRGVETVSWTDSLIVGTAQAMALFPGASRSGTTITAGLFIGLDRESSARFSFLLSIPAVFASGLFELKEALPHLAGQSAAPLVIATAVSAVTGYAAISFLLRYLKTHDTNVFVLYRLAVGAVIVLALVTKSVQP